jgi:HAMP domain-containing protein
MAEKEYFIDDRVIIPDEIKRMSVEELERAIKQMEDELKSKKPNK